MSEGEPPTEGEPAKRLNDLDDRLRRLRERAPEEEQKDVPRGSAPQTAYGFAFRIGVELVVALAVGGGIGWLLDHWLGTLPLFLLVFFVLGAVAGLLNVFRAAKQMNRDV